MPIQFAKNTFSTSRSFASAHKAWATGALIVVLGGGYWGYQKAFAAPVTTRYVLGTVDRGTITSSVTGSGQVSTTDTVDIKPEVSGTITYVADLEGKAVRAGTVIARIDDSNARDALAAAERQYKSDQLQYKQNQAQAPISFENDQDALSTAQKALQTNYDSVYNDLVNTYVDTSAALSSANDAIYGSELKERTWNTDYINTLLLPAVNKDAAVAQIGIAKSAYANAELVVRDATTQYQETPRTAAQAAIDTLIDKTITAETSLAQALQAEVNTFDEVSKGANTNNLTLPSSFSSLQSTTRSALSTVTTHLSTLNADKKSLDSAHQSMASAQHTVDLDKVANPDGSNPISLQVTQNNLQKEADDIASQERDLAKYTVVAPFSGTISTVSAHVGDSAGSAIATIVSNDEIADLSLNEVDAAKVQAGQKATLTFDAIDGLSIAGHVASISPVGTVSQGVVSYEVKIAFDTHDERVKPGMTVNAAIMTAVKTDALVVPSSAIKTANGSSYVLVAQNAPASSGSTSGIQAGVELPTTPQQVPVTVGISSDTEAEVVSGLTEGQTIVTRTVTATQTPAKSSAPSLLGGGAGGGARAGGFGGGGARTGGARGN